LIVTKDVSKWDYRYFRVYSGNKLIKELDVKEARKIGKIRTKNSLIVAVGKTFVTFTKGFDSVNIHKARLLEILGETK
jgi:hypothetical protein